MSSKLVSLEISYGVAVIAMDDGQSNLISPSMLAELNAALDEAEANNAVVVLTGREGILSAGFDLKILRTGVGNAFSMLTGGFKLARRLLAFPTPTIIACNGHAVAMGSFLTLSADYRLGTHGDFRIVANEVKLGLTLPHAAVELCRQRLSRRHFPRVAFTSEEHNPESALKAGFFDELVTADELLNRAGSLAKDYAELDLKAHRATKLRSRKKLLRKIDIAIWKDRLDFVVMGVARLFKA